MRLQTITLPWSAGRDPTMRRVTNEEIEWHAATAIPIATYSATGNGFFARESTTGRATVVAALQHNRQCGRSGQQISQPSKKISPAFGQWAGVAARAASA